MGPVGVQEMVVIFLVALVLFGPKKLPELGRTIGKAITEFRRAQSELKSTFDHHMRELEKENESVKEVTRSFTSDLYNQYDSNFYDSGNHNAESHPSTAVSPSTVGASATLGAESTGTAPAQEVGVTGTVARSTPEQLAGLQPEPSHNGAEPHIHS
ncbi:MAG TPA: twin-arginine translocase TatA/TatE family subunit [Bryobacteraceae bacterium]|nr:twin-arginine translocase TatA/TatE family subunit [Bryobacteraceae bacterium]